MRDTMRLIATTIIWGAFISVAGVVLTGTTGPIARMGGGDIVAMMTILMAGALAMTYAVWHNGFQRQSYDDYAGTDRLAKQKRRHHDRIDRLIDDLDEDEIYELETRLLDRERQQETNR